MGKKSREKGLRLQQTNKGPTGKELSIILPVDNIDNIGFIDACIKDNILNQTNINLKETVTLIFMTHKNDPLLMDHFNAYKNEFKEIKIFHTEDSTLARLDQCIYNYVSTRFFCIKTLSPMMINGKLLSSVIEWLPHHLSTSLNTMFVEKSKFSMTVIELVDIDTYGLKEQPDLIDTRPVNDKLNVHSILLDEFILSKELGVKFGTAIIQNPQTGLANFVPGVVIQQLLQNKVPGSVLNICTVRQHIKSNMIRKQLRVIVDGNTVRAI